ncbi:MAG: hypothetical protein CMB79_23335 [Filomicrobium sp.]|nr:hypothetical protein [Filomicrobium sp.]
MVGTPIAHITPPFLTQHWNGQAKAVKWRGPGRKFQQGSGGRDIADSTRHAIPALWKGPGMHDSVTTTKIAPIIAIG